MSPTKKRKTESDRKGITSSITSYFNRITTPTKVNSIQRKNSDVISLFDDDEITKNTITMEKSHVVDITSTPPHTIMKTVDVPIRTSPITPTIKWKKELNEVIQFNSPIRHIKSQLDQKPITPSSTVKSSMNNSLVFDIVTSLSTNDPEVANSALRSVVALGKEYPTPLLFEELLEHMENDSNTYDRALAIYSSMVFIYEQALQCNTSMGFPLQWSRVGNIIQDVALKPMDVKWQRSLLVFQFMVHFFIRDVAICQERFEATNKDWMSQTRLHTLLAEEKKGRKSKKMQNSVILSSIGRIIELWVRVYDMNDCPDEYRIDGKEACIAGLRLLELLLLLTEQVDNAMQKIQSGMESMSRETRHIFLQVLQSPRLKIFLGTTALGRTSASRSKEMELFDCIAQGEYISRHFQQKGGIIQMNSKDSNELQRYAAMHLKVYSMKNDDSKVRRLYRQILN